MKIAIIGSRTIENINLQNYLPPNTTEIVSGGAKGVDTIAKNFAVQNSISYTEFLPDYASFGRAAPIKRNDLIIEYCDEILAFWDGKSRGTEYVIKKAEKQGKKVHVIQL